MPQMNLIELLARSILYKLDQESQAYFALTDQGEWYLIDHTSPNSIRLRSVRFSGPESLAALRQIDFAEGLVNEQ